MKVLILSVKAGEGHNAMGKAIINELNKRGYDAKMFDYFQKSPFRQFLAEDWYFWMLKHFPKTSHRIYENFMSRDVKKKPGLFSTINFIYTSRGIKKRLKQVINEYQPDFIYCTHVYPAILVSKWRKEKYLKTPCFYIVSDYVLHLYTELTSNIDYLLTPCLDLNSQLFDMGFKEEQLLNFGITVQTKYSVSNDLVSSRIALGLNPNLLTILIIGGGTGFGKQSFIVRKLCEIKLPFQIVVVNGRNQNEYDEIEKIIQETKVTNVFNYGFVDNVDQIMDASTLMIGKIGGVGVTEAFNKCLPVLLPSLPPFQEYDNYLYLAKKECVIYCENGDRTKEVVEEIINNPQILNKYKSNISNIRKPNATVDLVNFFENKLKESK